MAIMIPTWVDGDLAPVEKLAAHKQGLRHKAVSVFVLCGKEVLIQRRALTKYHTPGLWANTCCTHPEWDEAPEACAVRRLEEELGIKGVQPVARDRIEYRADVGGGMIEHEVVDLFTVEAPRDLAIAPNPDEVMDLRWILYGALLQEVRDAPYRFTPWLRIYLQEHGQKIFGTAST